MSNALLPKGAFPAESVTKILNDWWNAKTQSPLKSPTKGVVKGTVFALQPELSSQQAVGVLVACKQVLGYRPSKDTIKKGGYANKADFVKTLSQEIQKEFAAKQPKPSSSQAQKGVSSNAAAA